jgi:AcrR family transcriptional regulator
MPTKPRRKTYRHGNVHAEAIAAAWKLIAKSGHEALSVRQVADAVGVAHRSLYNHFKDREALLDAIATEAFARLGNALKAAKSKEDYTAICVRYALANRRLYRLMTSRPHATMKFNPPLQTAVHSVITEGFRLFTNPKQNSAERRRAMMKVFIIHFGGITQYVNGVLDLPNEDALVAELSAMTAGS